MSWLKAWPIGRTLTRRMDRRLFWLFCHRVILIARYPITDPWHWYVYLHECLTFMVNIGKFIYHTWILWVLNINFCSLHFFAKNRCLFTSTSKWALWKMSIKTRKYQKIQLTTPNQKQQLHDVDVHSIHLQSSNSMMSMRYHGNLRVPCPPNANSLKK